MYIDTMIITQLQPEDVETIGLLTPKDWLDIAPSFMFYIKSDFCFPIKVVINNKIVGIGSTIIFEKTSWLAHIIVHPDYRKQGIGAKIVNHQLKELESKEIPTVLLIATKLGEPIYRKAGFKTVSDYIFLNKERSFPTFKKSIYIQSYSALFQKDLLKMDKEIMGENRVQLLLPHLSNSFLYIQNNLIVGYYIPTLGEGTIIATTVNAGLELMKLKYQTAEKAVIPIENKDAHKFLLENGFVEYSRCPKMIFGKEINWQPQNYYSRIGGYLG